MTAIILSSCIQKALLPGMSSALNALGSHSLDAVNSDKP
jgi:hypothetical protein